ncbi:hypothetical protein Pcinc_038875 [Petrolisthes cinctipes]|uniref:Uncharacterized protein n=1 Tax=Petrolisthes cinctipes TaxID=88211 RepID=A0AAE1BQ33_PETCI|nr:hypothetical protein Pcinc_038875 [Petrolisthes cinctipes]
MATLTRLFLAVYILRVVTAGGIQFPPSTTLKMKFVLVLALATVAVALPDSYETRERKFVPIIKDERIREDDGRYNFDVETGNGIFISQSGSPVGEGAIAKAGEYSYTAPNGEQIYMKFVADENGFQPQSSVLPVAPEFPHPIPQFVLDQIQRAAEEDAARGRGEIPSYERYD